MANSFTPISSSKFTPIVKPEEGFFHKLAESYKRSKANVIADIGVYEAMRDSEVDMEGVLNVRRKLKREALLHPIEGNFLTDILYKSAGTFSQIFESTKRAGIGAAVGAGLGAGVGAAVGAISPSVGEEVPLVATGAKAGAKLFAAEAAGIFSYRQGVGSMYADMVDSGTSPEVANQVAKIAGIPYALTEVIQLKGLTPNLKAGLSKTLEKNIGKLVLSFTKKYGTTLSKEVAEELVQEVIQISAEDTASYLDGQGLNIDKKYITDRINRVVQTAKEATQGFALLPLPGAVIETSIMTASADIKLENEAAKLRATNKSTLKPSDVTHPVSKFSAGIRNSIDTFESQEQVRKTERGIRFKAGEESIKETPDTKNWRQTFKRELSGEYTKLGIVPLKETVPLEAFESLDSELRSTDKVSRIEAVKLGDALENLYTKGEVMRPHEIKYAEKVWGKGFASLLDELSATVQTNSINIEDWISLPKATAASMDLSRSLRQNILLIGKPKLWVSSLREDMKLLLSDEDTAKAIEKQYQMELDTLGGLVSKSGIRVNSWGTGAGYNWRSERFASRLVSKIPGLKRSEQAYSAGGNIVRMKYLKDIANNRKGIPTTDKEWADIGHVLNILSGEGDPKRLGKYAPFLNAVFFAPRLTLARINAISDLLNPNISWAARKILAYHVATFVAFNASLLASLAAVPNVDVESDYRSTDFGKIRIGKQRIDFWGGYLPLARVVMRMINPEIKTQSGRTITLEREDAITTFLQSKLGPLPAFAIDMMKGQTFYGEDVSMNADNLTQQFYQRFTPFFIQDVIDALQYQGIGAGLRAAPLAFFGAGVQTYPTTKNTQVIQQKNMLSQQVFGANWDDLGETLQGYVKSKFPEVAKAEMEAKFDSSNFTFLNKIAKERDKFSKQAHDALPRDVARVFDSLNLKVSGIGRTISADWYLNDKRYKEYKMRVIQGYKTILPKIVKSNTFEVLPEAQQVELLTQVMDEIKNSIRDSIVNKAKLDDLQKIRRL